MQVRYIPTKGSGDSENNTGNQKSALTLFGSNVERECFGMKETIFKENLI
jgi:hypothetical protein